MKTHGAKCTCPTCGHQHERMRKATDDEQQERASKRGLRGLKAAETALREDAEHEREELRGRRKMEKSYTAKERHEVRRDKTDRYGKDEYFAVPSLRSYPLTKDGKPSEERTMAAWRYINTARDEGKLTPEQRASGKRRIRAFAKKHFGKTLEEGADKTAKALPADEVYALQDRALWPLTKALQPDPTLIRGAWQAVHSIAAQPLLSDEEAAVAEARIAYFAAHHKIAV